MAPNRLYVVILASGKWLVFHICRRNLRVGLAIPTLTYRLVGSPLWWCVLLASYTLYFHCPLLSSLAHRAASRLSPSDNLILSFSKFMRSAKPYLSISHVSQNSHSVFLVACLWCRTKEMQVLKYFYIVLQHLREVSRGIVYSKQNKTESNHPTLLPVGLS